MEYAAELTWHKPSPAIAGVQQYVVATNPYMPKYWLWGVLTDTNYFDAAHELVPYQAAFSTIFDSEQDALTALQAALEAWDAARPPQP
jgi:hypothetical protein